MSFNTRALRLEDTAMIMVMPDMPEVPDLPGLDDLFAKDNDSSDIVAAALPLIECVLENEDEETVKEIVACVLNHDVSDTPSKDDSD